MVQEIEAYRHDLTQSTQFFMSHKQIYWIAPTIGGLLATCTYQLLFAGFGKKQTDTSQNGNYTVEMTNQNDTSKFIVSDF